MFPDLAVKSQVPCSFHTISSCLLELGDTEFLSCQILAITISIIKILSKVWMGTRVVIP